jgi:hypothetical protein
VGALFKFVRIARIYWAITPIQKMIKPVENKTLTIKEVYPLISTLSIKYFSYLLIENCKK